LANATRRLLGFGAIALEAMQRLHAPQASDSTVVMWVAALGIVINAATAAMFLRGRQDDLNIHAAFLHMADPHAHASEGAVRGRAGRDAPE